MIQLNDFQKFTQIPQAIEDYLSSADTSQAQLSRVSGVGEAYLSRILQRKTHIGATAIKDKYYKQLAQAINLPLKQQVWRHFNTHNFKRMIHTIETARLNRERLVIDGDTGSGKTHACRQYLNRYPNSAYLVTCSAVENSKEFCKNIAEVVGVDNSGTAGVIVKKIIRKLLSTEDAVLIIDEAEHIGRKMGYIHVVKALADGLNGRVSMVLVGMGITELLQKGFDRRRQNFRQTARRFGRREQLTENITEDIAGICTAIGLTKAAVVNWLQRRIQNFGDLEILIKDAFAESEKSGGTVDVKLLNTLYI